MNHTPTYSVTLNHEVLRFLQEPEPTIDGRFDKLAAFTWLTDNAALSAKPRKVNFRGSEVLLTRGQLATSFSELSETWGWHRNNVRYFLVELERLHALTMERRGKAAVLTLPLLFEGETTAVPLLSPEDTCRLHFVLGMAVWEELVMLFDDAITGVEEALNGSLSSSSQDMNDKDGVGRRLHRLLNHLMLCSTDLFPRQDSVADALRILFIEEAGCDIAVFFSLLSLGGVHVLQGIDDEPPLPLTLSDTARQLLTKVLDYYTPILRRESPLLETATTPNEQQPAAQ